MPIDSRSALAFGPSFVFSGMLSRVANRLSHTFFMICMTSRLFSTPRMFQYSKSPKNIPRFPYLQQRLWRLSLRIDLSWRWALFPIFQHHLYFGAAPPTWGLLEFGCSIEQILAFSPWVIVRKPSSMSHEHGF